MKICIIVYQSTINIYYIVIDVLRMDVWYNIRLLKVTFVKFGMCR